MLAAVRLFQRERERERVEHAIMFFLNLQSVSLCASLGEEGVKFWQERKNVTLMGLPSHWKEISRAGKELLFEILILLTQWF